MDELENNEINLLFSNIFDFDDFFNEMNEQDDDSASKSQEITSAAPTAGAATSAPPPLVTTPTRNFRSVSVDSFLLENENLNTKK
ncbi:hypothetical protein DPMN_177789 [Dreissena polymorpha]|uniref:Uncharacterized protein n=1 Tax=Dreissena polymorpha TaxID=45954 RepID=A0A9D4CGH0_DREPO|nr:hypothetical protein DPMN_049748 [Dreissena polymorpha]KAH3749386.1 hypothetical protein DPMN_183883 [Dreissena polymorpha]KAH3755081.1 hypothetical protein DPMN_189765 [Dreissena polymorpha]KAH3776366.1 hypothetical protein DPMN_177789 [Dreissena polymorpha]